MRFKSFTKRGVLLVAATIATATNLSAQTNQEIDQIVVSVAGSPRKLKDTPVPISVITAAELKQGNIFSIEDALTKLSPNISVMTNGMGTTVSLNGLDDDYFVFLENGDRIYGDNPFARIDMSRVVRIEILSGASSVLYGTNAIGGVINIVTEGAAQSEDRISGNARTQFSSHGRLRTSLGADVKRGKVETSTNFSRNESDGWQLNEYVESGDELLATNRPASVGFRTSTFSQSVNYNATERLSFKLNGSYYDYKTRRPQTASEGNTAYTYDMAHEDITLGTTATYKLKTLGTIEANYYWDHYTSSYDYFNSATNGDLAGTSVERKATHFHNANLMSRLDFDKAGQLTSGLEYIRETLTSVSESVDLESAFTATLYSQYEVSPLRNLYFMGGFRYSYHEEFNSNITYHAAVRYAIAGLNLRASYSTGFKAPTLSNLYAPASSSRGILSLPNIDLRPETNNYYSVNAEYSNKWFSASVTAYQNNIKNMISYEVIAEGEDAENYGEGGYTSVKQLTNSSEARVSGVTVAVNLSPGYGITIGAGYNYIDAVDYDTNMPTNRSVPHVVTANASWGHQWQRYGLKLALNGRFSDERYSVSYGYAPSYQQWDFTTSHSFKLKSVTLEPTLGVENIFNYVDDRPWNSNYATLTPGRSFFAALGVKF
ncbi:MAG: TonB-dependent receptor [Rikenellaceae bacterium]